MTVTRKDREGKNWYSGSITNYKKRELTVKLDFLDTGKSYIAEIYADGQDADFKTNPYSVTITKKTVDKNTSLNLSLAAGGGTAIGFTPL